MSSVRKGRRGDRSPREIQPRDTYTKRALPPESTMGVDVISQLPDHILYTIMENYLSRKDVARTCVLSKSWRAINYRNPFLAFDERYFFSPHKQKLSITVQDDDILFGDFNYGVGNEFRITHPRRQNKAILEEVEEAVRKERHDLFMNYIESRIAGLLQHESHVEQFHLTIVNFNHECDSSHLDLWLKHAFGRNMWNLVLNVFTTVLKGQKEILYSLPSFCLVSQTLTQLMLANCKFDDVGDIELPHLKRLFLSNLGLEDDFAKRLIFGCPLLEVMDLSYCTKLTRLVVSSIPNLEKVVVRSCPDIECLGIWSSQLQYFQYHGGLGGRSCNVGLTTSNVIKQMIFSNVNLTYDSGWLLKRIANCEELTLKSVCGFENTKLSSEKLRNLTIQHCPITKVVEIDCPNLHSFNYFANRFPSHYVNPSELRKIIFEISVEDYQQHISYSDKLKEYFGNCNPIKSLIKQSIIYSENHEDVIIGDGSFYKSMTPMLGLAKVLMPEAKLIISSLDVKDFVDYFCGNYSGKMRRQTLNIIATHNSNRNFPQALYYELSRIKGNADCREDGINQCWRHKLSNVTKDLRTNHVPKVLRSYKSKYYKIRRILLRWKI